MKQLWRWFTGIVLIMGVAMAQVLTPNDVVPGEILMRLKPGTTLSDARAIAESINAEVRPIQVNDTYRLKLRETNMAPAVLLERVQSAIKQIENHNLVRFVEPHYIYRVFDIPNDPLFSQQWALQMMKLPAAWDSEKGQAGIRIAIIDDNFQRNHPDLNARYDPLSRNFVPDGDPDENIDPEGGGFSHGTSVMGVAAAATNNGIGIAGLVWEGVTVVALKTTAQPLGALIAANIFEAMQYVANNAKDGSGNQQIHVVNMSFGGPFPSQQENALVQEMYRAGVIPVAAAGNDNSSIPSYPANFENVVNVAAVGPSGARASYSNFAGIDIAAPGGDQQSRVEDGVITTVSTTRQYDYVQGTSYASPYVAAALSLILSAGAPVHSASSTIPPAVEILYETADPRGRAVPDTELGFGIVDMEAALRGVGGIGITFVQPVSGTVTDTKQVPVTLVLRRVLDNNVDNIIEVALNGDALPRSLWEETAVVDVPRRTITLNFVVTLPGEGRHTITVRAIGQDGTEGSRETRVVARAHVVPAGLRMFATPYVVTSAPEEIFGSDVILARYLPSEGTYARYSVSNPDPRAGFNPPGVEVRPDGTNTPTPPRGVGYFLRSTTPGFILGDVYLPPDTAYLVPLQEGWNMVGNPFPYDVPWAACEVEITGGAGFTRRISLQEAADLGYIRLQLYRYVPLTGEYTWRTAPLGELVAWQSHWVRALKPCTLIIPPVGTTRSRADETVRVSTEQRDGWLVRLVARSRDREDTNNFIGTATRGQIVEKPPVFQSYVNVRLLEPNSRSVLAQDVRGSTRRAQRWEVEVTTDQPEAEVTLQWSQEVAIPRGVRLTLIDRVTGERISMLQRSSYTFRTDSESRRSFVIEATPSRGSQLRITNVGVNSTRGNQFSIQYALNNPATVQVVIEDATGKPVARLQNGSRSSGVSTVVWNGRTDSGIAVPPGAYRVQIIATGEEGEVSRVVRPLMVTR
ncbi:MAG: S8 family serine peptidase [Fimbriimonadales bacterium]